MNKLFINAATLTLISTAAAMAQYPATKPATTGWIDINTTSRQIVSTQSIIRAVSPGPDFGNGVMTIRQLASSSATGGFVVQQGDAPEDLHCGLVAWNNASKRGYAIVQQGYSVGLHEVSLSNGKPFIGPYLTFGSKGASYPNVTYMSLKIANGTIKARYSKAGVWFEDVTSIFATFKPTHWGMVAMLAIDDPWATPNPNASPSCSMFSFSPVGL